MHSRAELRWRARGSFQREVKVLMNVVLENFPRARPCWSTIFDGERFKHRHHKEAVNHPKQRCFDWKHRRGLGTSSAQRYTSTAGLISLVGSATLQIQLGVNSGTWQVSSAITVNSGGSSFSFKNFGRVVNVNLNQAASQSLNTIFIYGQP
jgi:hypothetical protein